MIMKRIQNYTETNILECLLIIILNHRLLIQKEKSLFGDVIFGQIKYLKKTIHLTVYAHFIEFLQKLVVYDNM